MGVLIGSAVVPIALCLMWKKTNKWGAMGGAVLGQWAGLVSWLIFAKVRSTFAKSKAQLRVLPIRVTSKLHLLGFTKVSCIF